MDRKRLMPLRAPWLRTRAVLGGVTRRLASLARATTHPGFLIGIMLLAAGACAVSGVWMLAGTGWAFIAAAAVLFGLAGLALRGMVNG
jgi:hypothetical protein